MNTMRLVIGMCLAALLCVVPAWAQEERLYSPSGRLTMVALAFDEAILSISLDPSDVSETGHVFFEQLAGAIKAWRQGGGDQKVVGDWKIVVAETNIPGKGTFLQVTIQEVVHWPRPKLVSRIPRSKLYDVSAAVKKAAISTAETILKESRTPSSPRVQVRPAPQAQRDPRPTIGSPRTPSTPGTGSITGTVKFVGTPPQPMRMPITTDTAKCGTEKLSEELVVGTDRGVKWAVVSLVAAKVGKRPENAVLDQTGCQFIPHVVVVPVGVSLEILNNDRLLYDISTHSTKNPPINVVQSRLLKKMTRTFTQPEIMKVTSAIHPWMTGWIVVADTPTAVTDEKGSFTLTDIPPGTYKLKVWHEELGETAREVTVKGGEAVKVAFDLAGDFATQARMKIIEAAYKEAKSRDTIESYERFMEKYPNSQYDHLVKARIAEIQALAESERIKERMKWEEVKKTNTLEDYVQFINLFPKGSHVEEAKDTIKVMIKQIVLEAVHKANTAEAVGTTAEQQGLL